MLHKKPSTRTTRPDRSFRAGRYGGIGRGDGRADLARPAKEVAWGAGDWSHPDLEGFLETLGAALSGTDRFDALDPGAWKAFAEMLLTARVYE
jgi:hypothetical protein